MSTISAFRRRGYTPAAIREFCERIGVTRSDGVVDMGVLEFCIRDDLDANAPRAMCVLKPLKVTITNYPEDKTELLSLPRHPKQDIGVRELPFEREIYIDQDDYMVDPPKGYKRVRTRKVAKLKLSSTGYRQPPVSSVRCVFMIACSKRLILTRAKRALDSWTTLTLNR